MEPSKIEFVGSPCGHHGPYTFYKAFKCHHRDKIKILSLGEFFFVQISGGGPVCIGELQLLWEDKNNSHELSSVRLYFLPEDTPEGRHEDHGEDEVVAVSEKVVLRIEDLLTWIVEDVTWTTGCRGVSEHEVNSQEPANNLAKYFTANNSALELKDVNKERELLGLHQNSSALQIIILSYPKYCRYKSVLKRLEGVTDKWLRHALVCAIGGFTVTSKNTRILFCREMFEHPELDEHELRCDHLAPNLKGRPRKKRRTSDSGEEYKVEDDLPVTKVETRKNGLRITNKKDEEQHFLAKLYKFMKERGTPITKIPSLGFRTVDLYSFYMMSKKIGGYEAVTTKRLWKYLYDRLGGNPGSTSAATCTRRHYEKLLLPYERYEKGLVNNPNLLYQPRTTLNQPKLPTSDIHTVQSQRKIADSDFLKNQQKWEEMRRLREFNKGRRHSPTGIGNVVKKEISSDTVSSESYYKPVLTEHTHNRPSTGVDLRAAVFANPRLLVPDLSSRRPEQIGSSACPPPLLRSPTDGTTITERTRDMKALNGDSKPRLPPPPLIKSPTRTDSSVSALMKAPAINSQADQSSKSYASSALSPVFRPSVILHTKEAEKLSPSQSETKPHVPSKRAYGFPENPFPAHQFKQPYRGVPTLPTGPYSGFEKRHKVSNKDSTQTKYSYDDEQPTDLSMKTLQKSDTKQNDISSKSKDLTVPLSVNTEFTRSTDAIATLRKESAIRIANAGSSHDFAQSQARGSITKGVIEHPTTSPPTSGPKSNESDSSKPAFITSYYDPHGLESQQAIVKHAVDAQETEPTASKTPVAAHSKATPVIPDYASHLHPAFPMAFLHHPGTSPLPANIPTNMLQAQQRIYEAQLQAAQAAAYEDLMRKQLLQQHPAPALFVPPSQLYPHLFPESGHQFFPK